MALYREGKAAMAADGTVTGTGTKWQSSLSLIRPGATIMFLSSPIQMAVVNKVVSDTEIKAITTKGAVVASSDYAILLSDSLTVDGLAQDVAETLRYYQSQETVIADAVEFFMTFDFESLQNLANQVKADSQSAGMSAAAAAASEAAAKTSETNAKESEVAAKIAKDQVQQIINDAGEKSTLLALASDEDGSGDALLAVKQPFAGAVRRTQHDKNADIVSIKDFGASGDGITNDSAAFTAAKNYVTSGRNILALTDGDFNLEDIPATPSGGFGNDIKGLYVRSNKPSVFGVVEGSASEPSQTIDPSLWVQKIVRKDNPGDPYAHNIGAIYGGVVAKGDGVNVTNGTWMSGFFNCKLDGTLLESGVSDVRGNAIGLAGFAESVKPADGHITCGVWAVGSSPTMTAKEFSDFSGNFSTVGAEINLNINHPQAELGSGKGESAGLFINNYRKGSDYPTDPTLRDISIGVWLNGTDINGTYNSNNVDIYNGYQTGIMVDKIKYYGIEFGKYMANGAVGIKFPNSYAGMKHRMDTAIALGDHKVNLGNYTGSVFFDGDMWLNSGNLYLKAGGSARTIIGTTGVGTTGNSTATHAIRVNIGGVEYDILARKV